jgi:hypothetical protein
VCGVEASLPDGVTLGLFKFVDAGAGGDGAATPAGAAGGGSSVDSSMVSALEQMMAAFGYGPEAPAGQSASPPNPPSGAVDAANA